MTEQFDVLKEMGFDDPKAIEKFTTRTEGDVDTLKIYLRRQQGDWLSKSKKFKFKRADKSVEMKTEYGEASAPSAYFLKALAELEALIKTEHDTDSRKQVLLNEIDHLEKVVNRKIDDIRRQIEML